MKLQEAQSTTPWRLGVREKLSAYARELRPHHWIKNLLLFVPLLCSHHFVFDARWANTVRAFIVSSLLASGVYIINDLMDLDADRNHPHKRYRPLASGAIAPWEGILLFFLLIVLASVVAFGLPMGVNLCLAIYLVVSFLYSSHLKKFPILDIVVLSGLYVVRIIVGGFAGDVVISQWLITFSVFFFFSLACMKRYTELRSWENDTHVTNRRGYLRQDHIGIFCTGIATGLISVQVLINYLYSPQVRILYSKPFLLWLVLPLTLYWNARLWLLSNRGEMNEDPLVFAIKDKVSWGVAFIALLIFSISL